MSEITRRTALLGAATLAGACFFPKLMPHTSPPQFAPPPGPVAGQLRLACGEPGGRYIQFGELLREVLQARHGPALHLVTTYGSRENLALLASGEVDLAMSLADTATDAATDTATLGNPPVQASAVRATFTPGSGVVAIGKVYQNYLQCVVPADSAVRRLPDLAGRRVSLGAPGSGSSHTARRLLAVSQLAATPNPPEILEHTLDVALQGLAAGSLDALFWSGGIPTPRISEFSATAKVTLLDLSAEVPALQATHPGLYLTSMVPAGVYGLPAPTRTVGIPNYLLARTDLPSAAASAIVDALILAAHALVPAGSVGLQFLTPASLIDTGALALHPAAAHRYQKRYG